MEAIPVGVPPGLSAVVTIRGIELAEKIKKNQFNLWLPLVKASELVGCCMKGIKDSISILRIKANSLVLHRN